MEPIRQAPTPESIARIERALVALRRDQTQRRLQRRSEREAHGGDDATDAHPGIEHGHGPFAGRRGRGPGLAGGLEAGLGGPGGMGGPGGRGAPGGRRGGPHHHDRSLGHAARFRMLDALEAARSESSDDAAALAIGGIAEAIGVDQPRASRLVQEAADAGHVRRIADPSDGRRSIVLLTEAGRAVLAKARTSRRAAVEEAIADFTPEEVDRFAALFERFVEGWPRD